MQGRDDIRLTTFAASGSNVAGPSLASLRQGVNLLAQQSHPNPLAGGQVSDPVAISILRRSPP